MLRVGERVLLLALSDESDKHPLGYLSSKLLTDVEGDVAESLYLFSRRGAQMCSVFKSFDGRICPLVRTHYPKLS